MKTRVLLTITVEYNETIKFVFVDIVNTIIRYCLFLINKTYMLIAYNFFDHFSNQQTLKRHHLKAVCGRKVIPESH
jgi:hypothetical protein